MSLRDLIRRARKSEPGAEMVATDAMLQAGYSPTRAARAMQHREVPAHVKEAVRRVQTKAQKRRELAAERASHQVPKTAARKANDQIYDLIHNRYFQSIPLDKLFAIVERAGFAFNPSDREMIILTGRAGRETWQLYGPTGRPVDHMLVLSWYKLESGRYEITAYVS